MRGAEPVPCRSLAHWRETVGRRLLRVDYKPADPDAFTASYAFVAAPLRGSRMVLGAGVTFRDKELVGDGDDAVVLAIARRGSTLVSQNGRETTLRRGQATMMRVSSPGTLGSNDTFALDSLVLPARDLAEAVRHLDDALMRPIPASHPGLGLLIDYTACLAKPRGLASPLREAAYRHVIDLVGLLAEDPANHHGTADAAALRSIRLENAKAWVRHRADDANLRLSDASAALGVSRRCLQRLFESGGSSFSAYLNETRLQAVHDRLADPASGGRRIIDFAFAAGFSDVSHFNRSFRRRFGVTQGDVREGRADRGRLESA